ncbi:MAG TPA: TIM barrel protein [Candidatus Limnocylindria bacterium]|jgi:deoxyribonuclease-4|nr:TIM barrel protein [Candidatus Limnocylindria bacterium]
MRLGHHAPYMAEIHVGPGGLPSRESPDASVAQLVERGYDACEIDFGDGFWMDWDFARRLGGVSRQAAVAFSVHAPLAAFLGHAEAGGRKHQMAIGMLDHTAGIAQACGAAPVVIHPGFLLGRTREAAIEAVVKQLTELRARLDAKGRAVPFGIEVMGRVQELGSIDDVLAVSARLDWVRPVIDFAHMHATSDGGLTTVEPFAAALEAADRVLPPGVPFHIHFSDVSYANRNEKAHVPYGEGTLRAEPLAEALSRFSRPATVILESPDEASNQEIRAILAANHSR